jgi:hypothetical protein
VSVVLLVAAILGGVAATYFFDDEAPLPARLCMGAPLGLVGLGLVGYLLGWAFGLSMGTVLVAGAIVLAGPVLMLRARGRRFTIGEDLARARGTAQGLEPDAGVVVTLVLRVHARAGDRLDRAFFEARRRRRVHRDDHNMGDLPSTSPSPVVPTPAISRHPELAGRGRLSVRGRPRGGHADGGGASARPPSDREPRARLGAHRTVHRFARA